MIWRKSSSYSQSKQLLGDNIESFPLSTRVQSLELEIHHLKQELSKRGGKKLRTILILMALNLMDEALGLLAVYLVFLR